MTTRTKRKAVTVPAITPTKEDPVEAEDPEIAGMASSGEPVVPMYHFEASVWKNLPATTSHLESTDVIDASLRGDGGGVPVVVEMFFQARLVASKTHRSLAGTPNAPNIPPKRYTDPLTVVHEALARKPGTSVVWTVIQALGGNVCAIAAPALAASVRHSSIADAGIETLSDCVGGRVGKDLDKKTSGRRQAMPVRCPSEAFLRTVEVMDVEGTDQGKNGRNGLDPLTRDRNKHGRQVGAPSKGRHLMLSLNIDSTKVEEKLKEMFKSIQDPFRIAKEKFCEVSDLSEYKICFTLLKSIEKLRLQDKIWKGICEILDWEYISSR
ncbi:hypothetical protein BDK51DRAFT_33126 [Blyttiomyces helicus]|uniref:Uncharacterized protein n=1 Tax=Blyttiomyces helicus TaxID=388810 RepID=A0A4P9W0Y2_9FUNG|nr:hypothetical protein BDK51DRAFT_33126 [Blyttiomyces helicus]|eukprot:RKO84220.1 hypothetical protein BDK51DRAFT_33126 [Blyttiomyces helicus]